MLATAGDVMLELKSGLFQHHLNARDAMLVPASYYKPAFTLSEDSQGFY